MPLGTVKPSVELSAQVIEAQARLIQLRAGLGIAPRPQVDSPWKADVATSELKWSVRNAQTALQEKRLQDGLIPKNSRDAVGLTILESEPLQEDDSATTKNAQATRSVVVHPTLLLAILKQNLEAPGRVWLLLRAIDSQGRGWLRVEDVRYQLTAKDSPWRVCGWRRLRQLLHQGQDIFWQRDTQDRLWLRGTHRIAFALNSGRLQGFPVELPIRELLGGIQGIRAAFYASFHSGRDNKPISRQTLNQVTGIAERTQRSYDQVARVNRQQNIAIGERYTQERVQERAWTQGRGVFRFVDTRGLQGREKQEYIAWHLPNSYQANYQRRSRGSRKRLNRKLADLLKKGITGNSEQSVKRVFFPSGSLAARAYNRDPNLDAYWHSQPSLKAQFWRVMARCSGK